MAPGLEATLWGLAGGSTLLLGAAATYVLPWSARVIAGILAFGCGVLISAVAYDLLMEGFHQGGVVTLAVGMLAGSLLYTVSNVVISQRGGRTHKRHHAAKPAPTANRGLAIAVGSILDGVPEALVLGIGLLTDDGVSLTMLAAIALSNFPEALSGSTDMRRAGAPPRVVFAVWGGVAVLCGVAAGAGAALLGEASATTQAAINAVAAGAVLTMIADTMIPEAVKDAHLGTGLLVVLGLLCAFTLSHAI